MANPRSLNSAEIEYKHLRVSSLLQGDREPSSYIYTSRLNTQPILPQQGPTTMSRFVYFALAVLAAQQVVCAPGE
jgi:hypothetical protein